MNINILMKLFKELFKVLISVIIIIAGGLFLYFILTDAIKGIVCIFVIAIDFVIFLFGFLYLWASLYGVYDVIQEIRRK